MNTKIKALLVTLFVSALFVLGSNTASAQVYVCKSKGAVVYHQKKDCSSLKKCKGGVETLKVGQAKTKKLRQCKVCFPKAKGTTPKKGKADAKKAAKSAKKETKKSAKKSAKKAEKKAKKTTK